MMRILIAVSLLFLSIQCYSQEQDTNMVVWNDPNAADSVRLKAIDKILDKVIMMDMDSSETLANMQLDFARKVGNKKFEGMALRTLLRVNVTRGDPLKGITFGEEALKIAKETNDKQSMASSYNNIGIAYYRMDNYSKAIEYYLKNVRIQEELGNKGKLGRVYLNIGICFLAIENYDKAEEYYNKALEIANETGDERRKPSLYISLGNLYTHTNKPDLAIEYYNKAINLDIENIDKRVLASGNHNIGLALWDHKNDPEAAIPYFKKALEIRIEMGNTQGLGLEYTGLGGTNNELGRYKEALGWCLKAYETNKGTKNLTVKKDACGCLYRAYKGLGQLDSALKYHEIAEVLTDSVINIDREKEINRKELSYQFEKKALADSLEFSKKEAVLKERTQKQKIGLMGIGFGLLLMIALAFSIYKGKKRSDELLLNILPEETAKELKQKGYADAKQFDEVTVLFTDFKGFTQISEKLSPTELVSAIDECFKAFDNIIGKYGIEKIKTIGDAYMAAGGLPVPHEVKPEDVVRAALEMRDWMLKYKEEKGENGFEIRIGVHTGPVVAGIVGIKKFQYDIWGDTVNTASRMESSGEVGKVNISEATYQIVKNDFNCEPRGKIAAKGKGEINMYFAELKA